MKHPILTTIAAAILLPSTLNAATFFINFENSVSGGSVAGAVASAASWTNFDSTTGNGVNITSSISHNFGPGYSLSFTGSQLSDASWNFRAFSRNTSNTVNSANFVTRKLANQEAIAVTWTISGIPAGYTVRVYGLGADGAGTPPPALSFGGNPPVPSPQPPAPLGKQPSPPQPPMRNASRPSPTSETSFRPEPRSTAPSPSPPASPWRQPPPPTGAPSPSKSYPSHPPPCLPWPPD